MRIESEKLERSEAGETEPLSEPGLAQQLISPLFSAGSSPGPPRVQLSQLSALVSRDVQSTFGRASQRMWLLTLTLTSILCVHAIDISNEFVDEDADAIVIEGGINSLLYLSFPSNYDENFSLCNIIMCNIFVHFRR